MSGTLTMTAWCPACVDVAGHYVRRGRPSTCRRCTARAASDEAGPEVRRARIRQGNETLGRGGRQARARKANATLGRDGRRARSLRANAATSAGDKRARGYACARARWGFLAGTPGSSAAR